MGRGVGRGNIGAEEWGWGTEGEGGGVVSPIPADSAAYGGTEGEGGGVVSPIPADSAAYSLLTMEFYGIITWVAVSPNNKETNKLKTK